MDGTAVASFYRWLIVGSLFRTPIYCFTQNGLQFGDLFLAKSHPALIVEVTHLKKSNHGKQRESIVPTQQVKKELKRSYPNLLENYIQISQGT